MKNILRRGFAFLIDFLIISIVGSPIGIVLSVSTPFLRAGGYILFGAPIILITILLIGYFYHIIFWSLRGQTPGKIITELRVIDEKGENPSLIASSKRYLGYLIAILTLGIAFVYILFQEEGRGIHDQLAKTKVITK